MTMHEGSKTICFISTSHNSAPLLFDKRRNRKAPGKGEREGKWERKPRKLLSTRIGLLSQATAISTRHKKLARAVAANQADAFETVLHPSLSRSLCVDV